MRYGLLAVWMLINASLVLAGPPIGAPATPDADEAKALEACKGKINGKIIWSTSRHGNHDIYSMNADGTEQKALTSGPKTDWYARFSPDGKQVIFTRSKMDWTTEPQADNNQMWDTWIINTDGTNEKLLIKDSDWATWRADGKTIIFARGTQVWSFAMDTQAESLLMDSKTDLPKAAILQNPHMSPDGKYIAITLRGSLRETGIWDRANKVWTKVGEGCQINWFPGGDRVLRMNPTGNGGSEVLSFKVKEGKPENPALELKDISFIDLPGRRSHEYFPQIASDSKVLVWAATQRGHDHDIADYEIYVWDSSQPPETAVRLTFHSGNDRWPDIWLAQ
jgi:hypothetical protein